MPSATAHPVSATHCAPPSYTTRPTCPAPLTEPMSTGKNAWHAGNAWRYAPSARQNSARSCAQNRVRSNTRRRCFRTTTSGVRTSGTPTTGKTPRSTATTPVPLPARPPVPRTFPFRVMSRWQVKDATLRLSASSSRTTPSPPCAERSATGAARMPAPAARSMLRSPLTRSKNLLPVLS